MANEKVKYLFKCPKCGKYFDGYAYVSKNHDLNKLVAGGIGAVGGFFLGGPIGAVAGFGTGAKLGGRAWNTFVDADELPICSNPKCNTSMTPSDIVKKY